LKTSYITTLLFVLWLKDLKCMDIFLTIP